MPTHVEKRGSWYVIIENATGQVKGRSKSRRNAEISSSIRTEAHRRKMREHAIEQLLNKLKMF